MEPQGTYTTLEHLQMENLMREFHLLSQLSVSVADQIIKGKGVGDYADTFAYDGHRGMLWNSGGMHISERWAIGDVITTTIDLTTVEGKINFYRNGRPVRGRDRFSNIRSYESNLGYSPAVSLAEGMECYLNCGTVPLMYAVDGFQNVLRVQIPQGRIDQLMHALFMYGLNQYEENLAFLVIVPVIIELGGIFADPISGSASLVYSMLPFVWQNAEVYLKCLEAMAIILQVGKLPLQRMH